MDSMTEWSDSAIKPRIFQQDHARHLADHICALLGVRKDSSYQAVYGLCRDVMAHQDLILNKLMEHRIDELNTRLPGSVVSAKPLGFLTLIRYAFRALGQGRWK
jgi:hypothetical protein